MKPTKLKLQMLKPRIATLNTDRLPVLKACTTDRKRGSADIKDRNHIRTRDNGLCQQCVKDGYVTLGAEIDHKRPLWAGGSDDEANKWLLCRACHDAKSKREAAARARGEQWPFD